METEGAIQAARFGVGTDRRAKLNPIRNPATEDLRFLAYAQQMAMTAQTDTGKRLFELFVEQEKKRLKACWLPASGLGQGGT